jgi:hypothetical protein
LEGDAPAEPSSFMGAGIARLGRNRALHCSMRAGLIATRNTKSHENRSCLSGAGKFVDAAGGRVVLEGDAPATRATAVNMRAHRHILAKKRDALRLSAPCALTTKKRAFSAPNPVAIFTKNVKQDDQSRSIDKKPKENNRTSPPPSIQSP